jgi:type I restriction-modification system DNA methylase subunit
MAEPPPELKHLTAKFEQNIESYRNPPYGEAEARIEFINPLFELLGWDVSNKSGHAEAYKDLIHEDAIKVGGSTKAPDYSFRIGGVRKFFLEAKKPSVTIKDDTSPAYQLRRYAWSAKLPLSILTNFAEFAVYDCSRPPKQTDKASVGRVLYLTYEEYEARWEEISKVFSKEAILQGSFDKFAEFGKGKRGTSPVDAQFLAEIESWREALAKNLALRNPRLSVRDLNFAVQRTIDRIIFLRMCEDRGIEHYAQLQALLNGENIYKRLQYIYNLADDKYNSGLFHFREEKDRAETPDELTLKLKIDDKVLKDIIGRLYYPESPYEFSVLGGDILGNVYEQFLGKVIRLTAGHHAVIEEKPEVKKAGGVYYTPAYIVDYIVKNTVGKLCEGKSPRQIEKFRILDPACGSGSFLIGAYTYLLNHHRDWYVNDGPQKHTKVIYQGAGGHWYLTTQEKKRILLNNIYGVDIDSQAVEVTKLSLLLKVLEGESEETIGKTLKLFRERALPDLGNNIKCGNSLIGPEFHKNKQMSLLGDEDRYRINALDWASEFPVIMKSGGFDVVIGNPPYVRIQALQEWAPIEVEHYKTAYKSAGKGNYDIYVVFVEKGLSLLNKNGRLGFILPHKFFNAQYGEPLRDLISKGNHLSEVVHFGDQQVFAGATTYTCMLFLDKAGSKQCRFVKVNDITTWRTNNGTSEASIPAARITASEWNFTVGKSVQLFERLRKMPLKLGNVADRIFQGLVTGADPVFILTAIGKAQYYSDTTEEKHRLENDLMHTLCKGSVNIRRYRVDEITKSILFPYRVTDGKAALLTQKELADKYPRAWEYLRANRAALESRERGKWKHDRWYAFGRSQNLSEMEQTKIMTPSIAKSASFTLDSRDFFYFVGSGGGGGGGYGVTLKKEEKLAYEYILGLLNSRLLDAYLQSFSSRFSGGYYAYNRQYIEKLPIQAINFSDPGDKARHEKIVSLVKQILDLHKQLAAAKNPNDKTNLQREVEATDRQIDQLVYELYGLTDEEIKIVEGVSFQANRNTRKEFQPL